MNFYFFSFLSFLYFFSLTESLGAEFEKNKE